MIPYQEQVQTRQLSYRKYDRAMRPIYECPENFRVSLTTPIYTFIEILNGLFSLMLWISVQNLKLIALPVPEIIGDSQKIWAVLGYTHVTLFSKIFNGFVFGYTLWMFQLNLKSVASPVPELIAIGVWILSLLCSSTPPHLWSPPNFTVFPGE